MRKLFFAIYFIALCFALEAYSATREITNPAEINQLKFNPAPQNRPQKPRSYKNDIPQTREEFAEYIRERAKKAIVSSQKDIDEASTLSIIHSNEYISQQAQEEKSTFQKIYEEALDKVSADSSNHPADILPERSFSLTPSEGKLRSEIALQEAKTQTQELDFEVISVELPNGETVTAPAKEHIPYLSSKIDILPNGLVRIRETVTVVANGEKLRYGLSKALPKYSVSRNGVKNSTIPYLNSVKINNTEIEYVLKNLSDRFLITPKKQFPLQNGIYTYEFDYMLDRKLWYYDDFNEFYWDVTGSFWNLAITTAQAAVRLPVNIRPLGHTLMLGFLPDAISEQAGIVTLNRKTHTMGFSALRPLSAGEGMFMLIRIPKQGFIDPDFNTEFKWFLEDYGDILFAFLGLMMIFIAYALSYKNIESSASDSARVKFLRTPMLYRMLFKGVFDKISFGAFLLDMYKKGFINIIKEDDAFMLVKKTDSLKSLSLLQQKALKQIFDEKKNSVKVTHDTALKLNRAYKLIEKDTNKQLKWLLMKLNAGYVLFSVAMILASLAAISVLSVDFKQTFGIISASSITIALYYLLFYITIKNPYLRYTARTAGVVLIIAAVLIMSSQIHLAAAIIVVAMVGIIYKFSSLFAKRNGLIRHNITEAQKLAKDLQNNADKIILGYQFSANQPNIFALDADDKYPKTPDLEQVYKMDIVREILKFM
ncbi:MAG: DUF2207 domain-containing protein [Alphaproteobacteria bacterium]|nr:DUF2207 domain-containing protein [Alphaproteobacteria bacterium]